MIAQLHCLSLLLAPAVQSPATDPLVCVPEDAVVVATVRDLDELRADAYENDWYKMLRDADFEPTWKALRETAAWKEAFEGSEGEVDPLELIESIHGSLTMFAKGLGDGEFFGGVLVDPGEERDTFERLLDAVLAAKEEHSVASYETYEDVELTVFETEDPDSTSSVILEAGGLAMVVFADDPDDVLDGARAMIDRLQGGGDSPGIAGAPLLAEARGGTGSPGRLELFVNTHAFFDAVPEEDRMEVDEETTKVFEALGVPQMTWVHVWLDLGEAEHTDFELRLRLPDEGYLRDWAGYLLPAPQQFAGMMPRNSSSISMVGFDVWAFYQSLWDLAEKLYPEEHGQMRAQFDGFCKSIGDIDLEGDLLSQITGEIGSCYAPVAEAEWLAAQGPQAVYAPGEVPADLLYGNALTVGLEDSELVQMVIDDLLEFAGTMQLFDPTAIETEEFQGREIQTLELPTEAVASWCFDDGLFVFSMYPSVLRAVLSLRGAEAPPSALQNERMKPYFAQHVDASWLGLADSNKAVRMGIETLGLLQSMFPSLGPTGGEFDNSGTASDFAWSFGKLPIPPAAVAGRYLEGTMISTLRVDGNVLKLRYSTR